MISRLGIYLAPTLILFLSGCETFWPDVYWDKHAAAMRANPEAQRYALAIPAAQTLAETCYVREYPRSRGFAAQPYFQAQGGRSQDELEAYTLKMCETATAAPCVVLLYNDQFRCVDTWARSQAARQEMSSSIADKINAQQQKTIDNRRQSAIDTCKKFGFMEESEDFKRCAIEVFNISSQIQAIKEAAESSAAASKRTDATLETLRKSNERIRDFEQSMLLLQQSSRLLGNPASSPRVQCQFNDIMKTISCY